MPALLETYRNALERLDATGLAACYGEAAVVVEREMTVVMSSREAVEAEMSRRVERYRSLGLSAARVQHVDVSAVADHASEARVVWALALAGKWTEFETRYWLVDRGAGPRIAAVLAGRPQPDG